ncbi:MAG: low molecular weight protein-tyrosine-phosphatase [bacterium]|nr:low molecular weight protein-tyrosine-phosphatase [bacterium]
MVKILFVCHGNICRSPMAEYIFKDMVQRAGLQDKFVIASAATSTEEIGSNINPPARRMLEQNNIPCGHHCARQVRRRDYNDYDYILIMDGRNQGNIMRIFGTDPQGKVRALLSFTDAPRDISDPWYTHDYQKAFDDIAEGCAAFLDYLRRTVQL